MIYDTNLPHMILGNIGRNPYFTRISQVFRQSQGARVAVRSNLPERCETGRFRVFALAIQAPFRSCEQTLSVSDTTA